MCVCVRETPTTPCAVSHSFVSPSFFFPLNFFYLLGIFLRVFLLFFGWNLCIFEGESKVNVYLLYISI